MALDELPEVFFDVGVFFDVDDELFLAAPDDRRWEPLVDPDFFGGALVFFFALLIAS